MKTYWGRILLLALSVFLFAVALACWHQMPKGESKDLASIFLLGLASLGFLQIITMRALVER